MYSQEMRAEVGCVCVISLWPSMAPASGRSRQRDGTAHVHRVTCEDDERRRPDSRSEASDEPRLAPRDALPPRSRGPGGGPSSEPEAWPFSSLEERAGLCFGQGQGINCLVFRIPVESGGL